MVPDLPSSKALRRTSAGKPKQGDFFFGANRCEWERTEARNNGSIGLSGTPTRLGVWSRKPVRTCINTGFSSQPTRKLPVRRGKGGVNIGKKLSSATGQSVICAGTPPRFKCRGPDRELARRGPLRFAAVHS